MKAEVTFSELYWNESLMSFFFRKQSIRTLDELMEKWQTRGVQLMRLKFTRKLVITAWMMLKRCFMNIRSKSLHANLTWNSKAMTKNKLFAN